MAGLLSVVYLGVAPFSQDHAAQVFRVGLFESDGPAIWNNWWFGGHHLPGYSVLSPAIGSWIGFRFMGVLAVVGSALLFSLIVDRRWGEPSHVGAVWFGATACISLYTGRLTFALGVFLALLAVFLIQRDFVKGGLVIAAAVALASPVASLFLACGGFSQWLASGGSLRSRDTRGVALAVAALLPAIAIAFLFPGGGSFPYATTSFLPALLVTAAAFLVVPRGERLVRVGLLVYAAALVAAFLLDTPMGGNLNRMGALLIGPLVACAAWTERRLPLLFLTPFLILFQLVPVIRDLRIVSGEEVVKASFYEPVLRFLQPRLSRDPGRVEVLPLDSHWESAYLTPDLPLARGWERQSDRVLNSLFYEGTLSATRYRAWLNELAVHYVAVPSAALDYSAEAEAELIGRRLGFLEKAFQSPDWTVFRVIDPKPLIDPPASLLALGTDSFVVQSASSGDFRVAIRWTPYWTVESGSGCVSELSDGFLRASFERPGRMVVKARFRPLQRLSDSPRCVE